MARALPKSGNGPGRRVITKSTGFLRTENFEKKAKNYYFLSLTLIPFLISQDRVKEFDVITVRPVILEKGVQGE